MSAHVEVDECQDACKPRVVAERAVGTVDCFAQDGWVGSQGAPQVGRSHWLIVALMVPLLSPQLAPHRRTPPRAVGLRLSRHEHRRPDDRYLSDSRPLETTRSRSWTVVSSLPSKPLKFCASIAASRMSSAAASRRPKETRFIRARYVQA